MRGIIALLLITTSLPTRLPAQTTDVAASVDLSAGVVSERGIQRPVALTLSPKVFVDGEFGAVTVGGTLSQFRDGWSGRGVGAASLFLPVALGITPEISTTLDVSSGRANHDAAYVTGAVMFHKETPEVGTWAGGGVGRGFDGVRWRRTVITQAGFWLLQQDVRLIQTVSFTSIRGSNAGPFPVPPTSPVASEQFVDVAASVEWSIPRVALNASVGRRFGSSAITGGWSFDARAVARLAHRIALLGRVGRFVDDPVQQLPGGEYLQLGMRIAVNRPAPAGSMRRRPRRNAEAFRVTTITSTIREIWFRAPGAWRVELMADFTDWRPVSLAAASSDEWRLRWLIPPGLYHVNIRINGGPWIVPPGLASVADGYGGMTGVLVVE